MSRWREMMMDYGQIFGSEKYGQSAGSDMFSITSDLKDKRKNDLQLRRTLEVHFRPLFQRFVYGGEKIACHDLRRVLHDPAYRDRLPPDKVQELADVADFNRGKAISYNEFTNIVLNQLPHDDIASLGSRNDLSSGSPLSGNLSCFGGFLLGTCRNTAPNEIVEERIEKYRCLPPPFFMILITVAQIIVHVVDTQVESVDSFGYTIIYDPTRRREAWRWITYCFLHRSYVDLAFNIAFQVVLGIPLEIMFSWWRMAVVYLVGVIIGSCSHSIADHDAYLVGAAGGSWAIVGAHVAAIVMNWKAFNNGYDESRCKSVVFSRWFRILVIVIVAIGQLCYAVHQRWFDDDVIIKIGIAAHIGGLLAGAIMGDAFLMDPRRSPMKHGAALIVLFTFLFFVGVTVVINIVWFDYPDPDFSSL